jgi:short-subunit dehydrogenase
LTKKKIIIFGYSGGLGKSIVKILKNRPYELILYNRKKLNFYSKKAKEQIHQILKKNNADIIINASGVLGDNFDDYKKIFDVNLMPNWEIIKFYKKTKLRKKVLFIFIGSSAYKSGRKNYILYASSKAALNNLYQGAKEYLNNKSVKLKLINFGKIYTPMIKKIVRQNTANVISPTVAALRICKIFDKGI